ncbi:MAG: quinoprotein dehydrogenase-associated SoxYZ-like carrier [Steroidobacterales bacterium]
MHAATTARRSLPWRAAALCCMALGVCGTSFAASDGQTPSSGAWDYLQKQFYPDRSIGVLDEGYMSLTAPANTPDPAATPLMLHFGDAAVGHIKQIRVIIDNNPSPLAATFDVAAGARVVEIGMRVRIDRFTSVRAIAESSDGKFEMRSAWVNASGGCSSPPGPLTAGALGDIRFRPSPDSRSLLISIRHPNNSGFQIDPLSGEPIPSHYVSHIRFSADRRTLLEADTGISLSENPTLQIASDQPLPAPIVVDIVDSEDGHFHASWRGAVAASTASATGAGAGGTR